MEQKKPPALQLSPSILIINVLDISNLETLKTEPEREKSCRGEKDDSSPGNIMQVCKGKVMLKAP